MKLVVISGRSGSGKSTALQALEDVGYYCIDNLPASLLPNLIDQTLSEQEQPKHLAVSIDARNANSDLEQFPDIIRAIRQHDATTLEIVFLDASETTLLKRYSATRRKHPLSDERTGLEQAIKLERRLLDPIVSSADLQIDTTRLTLYELRDTIKLRVAKRKEQSLSLQFESFGFKHGVPLDVDFCFDVRVLPNPYWIPDLRQYTGRDQPVIDFLSESDEVDEMVQDLTDYLERWLPRFANNNRTYVTVGIGCTGGQHRSVYIAEQLTGHFSKGMDNVQVRHRELT